MGKAISVIFVGKGQRNAGGESLFHDSFARDRFFSVAPHLLEANTFAINNTVSPWGILKNILELRTKVIGDRPNIVHAQWGSTTAMISLLAILGTKTHLVITFDGSDIIAVRKGNYLRRLRGKLAVKISRLCAIYAAINIAVSENIRDALPQSVKAHAVVLPDGVDIMKFKPINRKEARTQLSWDPDLNTILFVGATLPENNFIKNPELAEAAYSLILEEVGNITLQKIKGVPHSMMPIYLNAADVILITSLSEGSPNIVKEAMACNLPVVSVHCGDVAQRTEGVYPGQVVGSYNPRLLADAILNVLGTGIRSNGREKLKSQRLGMGNYGGKLVEIYNRIADEACKK